ncbi:hypothetical protein NE237_031134 [Protea cynaroides]|uniref:Pentatricopeptide repeat-containing protein n=1 Tax=Protea cynaroides TaxID=273540 RepID=A0A9Q0L0X3_9MAGN|nr:hypothetical protein NE237_031134 [Protea cynaroides]
MVLYHFQYPSLKPVRSIKVQPEEIDLLYFSLPKLHKHQNLLPKSSSLFSAATPLVPISGSYPIKSNENIQVFSVNSSTYSNVHWRNSVSPKPTTYPIKCKSKRVTCSSITFSQNDTKSQQTINQYSPATLEVLAQILKHGPLPDIVTYTTFIKLLGDSGHVSEAFELFALMKETHEPDVISFTVLIQLLCDSKMVEEALDLLHEMSKYNCRPDAFCYNTLIDKLGEAGLQEQVQKLWSKMQSDGIDPDVVTYSTLVKSHCVTKKMEEAISILRSMEKGRIKPNTYVYNTIIKAYLDHGQIREALGVMGRMMTQGCNLDLCSFNLFIKYYSDLGEGTVAYLFLKRMTGEGVEADATIYCICINGLIKQGKVAEVIELIERIKQSCVTISICTWNKLIMWLGEMGRMDEAYKLFLGLENPNEITMNSIIYMLYKHGRGDKGWEVFNMMKEKNIEASVVTYNILIHWLGRDHRISEAFKLVNQMESEQQLSPDVITYNCLLSGLCNTGQVDEACRLVLEMSKKGYQPDLISYNTLVNGMISVGRMDDASRLFEQMRGTLSAHSVPLDRLVLDMLREETSGYH